MPGLSRRGRATGATLGLTFGLMTVTGASIAGGAPPTAGLKASTLAPVHVVQGVKSATGRIARSDPALLGRIDTTPVNVVVKFDYDSVATYDGGLPGLAPTNPSVTGRKLDENATAVGAYENYVAREEAQIVSDIAQAVPAADVRDAYRHVYGGVSMTLPANEVKDLLAVDGVVAVQQDRLEQPQTDVTPEFIGATAVWPSLGGFNRAGEGVIVGVLDSGITPQHPSFQDPGIPRPPGTAGVRCEFGDGSDPQLGPPATCNDKLIGAYAFLDTYMDVLDILPGEFCNQTTRKCSARDADGHGTHTASTAAGSPVGLGADLRRRARADQRHRTRCVGDRVPRVRRRGLLPVRFRRRRRPGHQGRRRRHQLLDQRRRAAVQRPGRARLPGLLRRGRARERLRRQRRSGRRNGRPRRAVDEHRRRIDLPAPLPHGPTDCARATATP